MKKLLVFILFMVGIVLLAKTSWAQEGPPVTISNVTPTTDIIKLVYAVKTVPVSYSISLTTPASRQLPPSVVNEGIDANFIGCGDDANDHTVIICCYLPPDTPISSCGWSQ